MAVIATTSFKTVSAGKILIVEDDVLISELLNDILSSLEYEVVGMVGSLKKAQEFCQRGIPFDLALLDIRMHNQDQGIEVAKLMNQQGIPFIFITSFANKDILQAAVEQQPLSYILKPFKPREIADAVASAFEKMEPRYLVIRERSVVHHIDVNDILYLESENVYVTIHTTSGKIVHRIKLSEILQSLPSSFLRIHQSIAVNKAHIDRIENNNVVLRDQLLPVSRSYKSAVLESI